jgi:hypothetical protein
MKNQNSRSGLELQPAELEAVVGGYFPVPPILQDLLDGKEPPPRSPSFDPFPFREPSPPLPQRPGPTPDPFPPTPGWKLI